MFRAGASAAVVAGAHWGPQSEGKTQPMIDACVGLNNNSNCTTKITGSCTTLWDARRVCMPAKGKGRGKGKGKGHHGHRNHDGSHHHDHHGGQSVGDCDAKADGEECVFERPGICFPGMFANTTICVDEKVRDFATALCIDKTEGDSCSVKGKGKGRGHKGKGKGKGTGQCTKIQDFDELICKWNFVSPCEGKSEGDECTYKGYGKGHQKGKGKKDGRCQKCARFDKLVCKPALPCEGKSEGDVCVPKGRSKGHSKGNATGQCIKVNEFEHLVCKPESGDFEKSLGKGHGHAYHWSSNLRHEFHGHGKDLTKEQGPGWMREALSWVRGSVPTWWAKDGTPHWTSAVV